MRSATANRPVPTLEHLETRANPAGNIAVSIVNGGIVLEGDAADNQFGVQQDAAGNITVYGLDDTTVNGQPSVFVGRGTPAFLFADLKEGRDHFEVFGLYAGNVAIHGGADGDTIRLLNVGAAGNVEVYGEDGDDSVFIGGVVAGNVLGLDGGNGSADGLRLDGSSGGQAGTFVLGFEQPI